MWSNTLFALLVGTFSFLVDGNRIVLNSCNELKSLSERISYQLRGKATKPCLFRFILKSKCSPVLSCRGNSGSGCNVLVAQLSSLDNDEDKVEVCSPNNFQGDDDSFICLKD